MAIDHQGLFLANKSIVTKPRWREPGADNLELVAPLDVDGITVEGFRLRVTASKLYPDENVTFLIEHFAPRGMGGQMARIEWRPLKGHDNKGNGPSGVRHVKMTGSHHHSFDLNWTYAASQVRRGNLPIALPLTDEPADFKSLLAFAGKEFRINNIDWVKEPPWQPPIW